MLSLKKVRKSYKTGDFIQVALDDVSLKFREQEFVAILGPSGSGKTTLLNILGGLDRYDTGDLIINGKSTKKFKDKEWDAYRNNSVGFIFQSYNLIGHISILANVEMALKLSNVKRSVRRKKAMEALEKVGLKDHSHKRPNELSGGQMQRVAIARSLVNDPDIILADEPTGALDTKTSTQIMDLIKEVSNNKLVIMVTHNEELANKYATRIIKLKDGKVISDSDEYKDNLKDKSDYKLRKTKMSIKEALMLSFNNIITKKGRTLLTAFASSIGIIGIALILSLSNGFNEKIEEYEKGIMSAMPIIVSSSTISLDEDTIAELAGENQEEYPDYDYVIPEESVEETVTKTNVITEEYLNYLEDMPSEYTYGLAYYRTTGLNILGNYSDGIDYIDTSSVQFTSIPKSLDEDNPNILLDAYYDCLSGSFPTNQDEIVLVVDAYNNVSDALLEALGFSGDDNVSFSDLIGKSVTLVLNDTLYEEYNGIYVARDDYEELYEEGITLTITGIIRAKEEFPSFVQSSGFFYTYQLEQYIIDANSNSDVVIAQEESNINVLTGLPFTDSSMDKETMLSYLGASSIPYAIYIYPKDFDAKDELLEYLDSYNEDLDDDEKIIYTDQAELISTMSGSIMSAITIVLVAFSSISLIVSSIMIGIITYISVLERIKEIGILRSLGARKKDISRVFNSETFIIGLSSGLLGIGIALLLTIPINKILYNLTGLENVANLNIIHAIILVVISMVLTLIGGYIPARIASKKDPVDALRAE